MGEKALPPGVTPEILNDLYRLERKAPGGTGPEGLEIEIAALGLSQHRQWIRDAIATVLGAPYTFLDKYPGGAVSSAELWEQHDRFMRATSPWLDEDNFAATVYWSQYYAWHDGLVKSR